MSPFPCPSARSASEGSVCGTGILPVRIQEGHWQNASGTRAEAYRSLENGSIQVERREGGRVASGEPGDGDWRRFGLQRRPETLEDLGLTDPVG